MFSTNQRVAISLHPGMGAKRFAKIAFHVDSNAAFDAAFRPKVAEREGLTRVADTPETSAARDDH